MTATTSPYLEGNLLLAPSVVLFDYGHTLVDFRRVPSALAAAYEDVRRRLERHVS